MSTVAVSAAAGRTATVPAGAGRTAAIPTGPIPVVPIPTAAVHTASMPLRTAEIHGGSSLVQRRRVVLVIACIAGGALALGLGHAAASANVEAELATLLRGMALIKAVLVLGMMGTLWWRLGHPLTDRAAWICTAAVALAAGATALIWQLALIPLAALAFHAGLFTLLAAAWREHRGTDRPRRLHG
jgi:hypothetical protein